MPEEYSRAREETGKTMKLRQQICDTCWPWAASTPAAQRQQREAQRLQREGRDCERCGYRQLPDAYSRAQQEVGKKKKLNHPNL